MSDGSSDWCSSDLSSAVRDAGAAGVMVAPPGMLKTDDQIVAYYSNVVETIGLGTPFVLQDFPQSTNVVMAPSVIAKIVRTLPSRSEAHTSELQSRMRTSYAVLCFKKKKP